MSSSKKEGHIAYVPLRRRKGILLYAPLKKEGHIALHLSVCRSVGQSICWYPLSLNLVQLITQERFAPQASNPGDR